MTMAVKTRIDPIERSMLRDTMIRTMPVVMIATAADCTDRFQRLRGAMNSPFDRKLKAIHRTTKAAIMPRRRVSISRRAKTPRTERRSSVVTVLTPTSGRDR